MAGCSCRGMQPAPQPGILSRSSGPWQHHTWPTGPLAYITWPVWYPVPWWQGLPTTCFNECEQQPPSAAHDVPIPSGAADDAAPDHREYEEQPPTQRGREQYQQYVHITLPLTRSNGCMIMCTAVEPRIANRYCSTQPGTLASYCATTETSSPASAWQSTNIGMARRSIEARTPGDDAKVAPQIDPLCMCE